MAFVGLNEEVAKWISWFVVAFSFGGNFFV